jgi:glycine oxidase
LQVGCEKRGVELVSDAPVTQIETSNGRIVSVRTEGVDHRAAEFVFASGAWTGRLLDQIGMQVAIEPLKGQIVLLNADPSPIQTVIQVGREYLVPRNDGRILVGSTEEHTGFDKRTTEQARNDLIQFAHRVVPSLSNARVEMSWAGLRPYSSTGRPFIGRLPQFANACIAAGHFRYGLDLSPITAVLIRQILLGQPILLPEEVRVAND